LFEGIILIFSDQDARCRVTVELIVQREFPDKKSKDGETERQRDVHEQRAMCSGVVSTCIKRYVKKE